MNKYKNKRRRIDCPIQFSYPTLDDWSPNFPRNTVIFSVYTYHNWDGKFKPNGLIKIVVSGADDTAMAKDFSLDQSEYATKLKEIDEWCRTIPNPVSQEWLLTQSFKYE